MQDELKGSTVTVYTVAICNVVGCYYNANPQPFLPRSAPSISPTPNSTALHCVTLCFLDVFLSACLILDQSCFNSTFTFVYFSISLRLPISLKTKRSFGTYSNPGGRTTVLLLLLAWFILFGVNNESFAFISGSARLLQIPAAINEQQ